MRALLSTLTLSCVIACGPASVSGTVGGQSVDDSDAIAEKTSVPLLGEALRLVIGGGSSDLCADYAKGVVRKGSSRIEIALMRLGQPLEPVAYAVGSEATVTVERLDSACGNVFRATASAGSVTLTKVSTSGYEGRFLFQFGGDALEGEFKAAPCASAMVDLKSCE